MKVFAKLIIILATCDNCLSFQFNVGSVLFTSSDLQKNLWTHSELALLRARRHFQNLIPILNLNNSLSDENLSFLFNYADNCYTTIAKQADNPIEKELMTNALSDVIGGYLKVWVLPITKYSYYGGTISPLNAIKLFKLYDNIKQSLNTDGTTWKNPSVDLLEKFTINIAANPREYTRSIRKSCDSLSYYEKTDKGLTIPLPFISWDLYPQTMFIPLKEQSLVQLNSPDSSNALLDYYNIATSCIHSLSTDTIDDFGSRFQIWLSTDVVPHLKDDDLYVALGSCLSLLNKTKNLYSQMLNVFDNTYSNLQYKAISSGYPIPLTKRNILVAIIIIIEIVWCIPVLYYLLCKKKSSKKKRGVNHLFTYFKKDPKPLHGVKLFVKPRTRNLELDVEFPAYNHKYYSVKSTSTNLSQNNVLNNMTHVYESLKIAPKLTETNKVCKKGLSHKTNQTDTIETSNQEASCECKTECDKASCYVSNSQTTNNSSKTISSFTHTPSSFTFLNENEIKNVSYSHATLSVSKSMFRSNSNAKMCSKMHSQNTNVSCPCSNCVKNIKQNSIKLQCLKNVEKTRLKMKNPVVMRLINENIRDDRALYRAHLNGKGNSKNIRNKLSVVKEVNSNKTKEKLSDNLVKINENHNNIRKLPIANNKTTVNEKLATDIGKTTKTSKIVNCQVQLPLHTKDKKPQKNIELSVTVDRVRTSVRNVLDKKVSRRNKFTIVEVPRALKNIPDVDTVKQNKEDFKIDQININDENTRTEITTKSGIPKYVSPVTTVSIEPDKKLSKPCKIPRRITTHSIDTRAVSKKEAISPQIQDGGGFKKTVDDTAIKKPIIKNTRLNTTL